MKIKKILIILIILVASALFYDRDYVRAEDIMGGPTLKFGYSITEKTISNFLFGGMGIHQTDNFYFGGGGYGGPIAYNDIKGGIGYGGFIFGLVLFNRVHTGVLVGGIGGGARNVLSDKASVGGGGFVIEPEIRYLMDVSKSVQLGFTLSYLFVPISFPSDIFIKDISIFCFGFNLIFFK